MEKRKEKQKEKIIKMEKEEFKEKKNIINKTVGNEKMQMKEYRKKDEEEVEWWKTRKTKTRKRSK